MTPRIKISMRRPDGTKAYVEFTATPSGQWTATKEEAAQMLLETEMYGNSSMKIRVHLDGMPVEKLPITL